MTRTTIELFNLDKYDAYLPTPKVDRIEGDADEIILSADAYEASGSGGIPGSLTMNASGGIWIDTGAKCTASVSSRKVMSTAPNDIPAHSNGYNHDGDHHEECMFLSFDKNKIRSGVIEMTVQSSNTFTVKTLTVIHNNTYVSITTSAGVTVPSQSNHDFYIDSAIDGNSVKMYISGAPLNSIVSCICKYTLV